MGHKILLIDDDSGLLELLRQGLEIEGYTVITAESGKAGFRHAYYEQPDLILLDIMMPETDGWATYRQLRRITHVPVIVLTAMATREDISKGLSLGVDGFLTKPCSFETLREQIDQALDRAGPKDEEDHVLFNDGYLCIDLMRGVSVDAQQDVQLTSTEVRLLTYMARRKARLVPREELLTQVWGADFVDEVSYLDHYIHHLCQKIEPDPNNPRYLRLCQDQGYCFAELPAPALCS
jgi:DNA-binding response OmpR family regulator